MSTARGEFLVFLIVEDRPDEMEKAINALETGIKRTFGDDKRFLIQTASSLMNASYHMKINLSGIITDLNFPQLNGRTVDTPCGLAVVAEAIERKIPVAVCSDFGNHPDMHYAHTVVNTLSRLSEHGPIFVEGSKNWDKAVAALIDTTKAARSLATE